MKRHAILAVGLLVTALAVLWIAPVMAQSVDVTAASDGYYCQDGVGAEAHHNWMHGIGFDDHHRIIHGDDWQEDVAYCHGR